MELAIILIRSALISLCLWSLLRGGAPEKLGAILLLTSFIGRAVLSLGGLPVNFHASNPVYLALTAALFLPALALALRANRIWPIVLGAFLLVELSGHLSVVILGQGWSIAYWVTTQLPMIGQVLALTAGTWAYYRRQQAGIHAPDWRATLGKQP